MDAKTFGLLIRARRKEKQLTLAELAMHCNVGIRFLSELENGKETIEIGKAFKVMSTLNLTLNLSESNRLQQLGKTTKTD